MPSQSNTRARWARFAARLGIPDLRALDAAALEKFSPSELSDAVSAAGLDFGKVADVAGLLALIESDLARAERRGSGKRRSEDGAPRERVRQRPDREPARPEKAVVPWSYGIDRIGAMAVDPERLFIYWEVTDEAIEQARRQVGRGGPDALLVLRVYDITGRIFDGENAHGYFDHEIGREDRQWFFHIGRPASEACVELGLKSRQSPFVRICRSGRVEFPRRGPAGTASTQWLSVRAWDGETHLSAAADRHGPASGSGPAGPEARTGSEGHGTGTDHGDWLSDHGRWESTAAWSEEWISGTSTVETRIRRWEGPGTWRSWETGPVTVDVEAPAPLTESFVGAMRVYRCGPRTHVVYGPWEVVIRGLGAYRRKAILARWEVHRSWISEVGHEAWSGLPVEGDLMTGSSAALGRGASERRWLAGSELRLGGASELLWMGASERRLGGASERAFLAASEWRLRGASERRLRGASERRLGGASERSPGGASERRLDGASEHCSRRVDGAAFPRLGDDDDGS